MISQSQALSWKNFWSLTFPRYNTEYVNYITSIMINPALVPHGVYVALLCAHSVQKFYLTRSCRNYLLAPTGDPQTRRHNIWKGTIM
jgi:hypothetical protein